MQQFFEKPSFKPTFVESESAMRSKKNPPTNPLLNQNQEVELQFAIFYASGDDDERAAIAVTLLRMHYAHAEGKSHL